MINYYMVGGYVRDKLLNIKSKDIDFSVEAPSYEDMREDLIARGVKIFLETPQYFTIRGNHPNFGGVDYVLCRKDGQYEDGRHPSDVRQGTLLDDLARRDFTINAIAIKEDTNEITDPFNGEQDLHDKIIRCVGNPYERFQEDSLRILRAVRFSIKYGFRIEEETWTAMMEASNSVLLLPQERIREELEKCFKINTTATVVSLMNLALFHKIFTQTGLWLMPTNKER